MIEYDEFITASPQTRSSYLEMLYKNLNKADMTYAERAREVLDRALREGVETNLYEVMDASKNVGNDFDVVYERAVLPITQTADLCHEENRRKDVNLIHMFDDGSFLHAFSKVKALDYHAYSKCPEPYRALTENESYKIKEIPEKTAYRLVDSNALETDYAPNGEIQQDTSKLLVEDFDKKVKSFKAERNISAIDNEKASEGFEFSHEDELTR